MLLFMGMQVLLGFLVVLVGVHYENTAATITEFHTIADLIWTAIVLLSLLFAAVYYFGVFRPVFAWVFLPANVATLLVFGLRAVAEIWLSQADVRWWSLGVSALWILFFLNLWILLLGFNSSPLREGQPQRPANAPAPLRPVDARPAGRQGQPKERPPAAVDRAERPGQEPFR